jgi:diguanylate cyclase (GGDEF)-like protein
MIELTYRAVKGRVARRVFLLFVLSAFVPLALIAALSITQLRQSILSQGERRLATAGKEFGMAVFDRLQAASDSAVSAADLTGRRGRAVATRHFRSLGIMESGLPPRRLFGDVRPLVPNAGVRQRLAEGKNALVVAGASVFLLVPADETASGRIAFGELHPDYLWGTQELQPTAIDICVVDSDSRSVLFCPAPVPEEVLGAIANSSAQAAFGSLGWVRDGEEQVSVAWSQFLHAEFGAADWVVVASQSESYQMRYVAGFQQLFVPVVILALLVVMLLSIRQIRGTMGPLERLAAGAARVAQSDFATKVEVKGDDEFGQLATAFNRMSQKLGRQFSALKALSEIDRLILSAPETDVIVRAVLDRVASMAPADFASVILLDHENPSLAKTYSRSLQIDADMSIARQEIPKRDLEIMDGSRDGFWIPLAGAAQDQLALFLPAGVGTAFVQPIIWRNAVCGALSLGFRVAPALNEEGQKQVGELADRLTVAMSSAWRDEQLYQQAHYDALTGLPNRLVLMDRLTQEIARCQRESGSLALLFVDLDHFKNVNDTQGHASGDRVLKEAAGRISRCVRDSDTVSRHGGDEFTVILGKVRRPRDAGRVAEDIVQSLSEAFVVNGQTSFLSASVGIAVYPQDGNSAEALVKNADTAMYRAKSGGRARAVYFKESMNLEAVERVTLDRELRKAIDQGELELHYQPQLDFRSGQIVCAEALMRWRHPRLGLVLPGRFIPVAEEFGHIEQIGRWLLREACMQMKAWRSDGLGVDRLAVNISAIQFRRSDLVDFIRECTVQAGIGPENLDLEITETVLMDRGSDVERMLRDLAAMGVSISLDDFGTGFSSLSYLKRFPFRKIKIDRGFVDGLGRDSDSEAIVSAIVAMSHALGKEVVAEGAETGEQTSVLRRLGCDGVQGYHVSRPLSADEFSAFVRARKKMGLAVGQN